LPVLTFVRVKDGVVVADGHVDPVTVGHVADLVEIRGVVFAAPLEHFRLAAG
jgi:hypothetical protein